MQLMIQISFKRVTLPTQNEIRVKTPSIFLHTTHFWKNMYFCKNLEKEAMDASTSANTKPIKTSMLSRSSN